MSDENHDESIILPESIYEVIHFVRGRQVLLDQDLAELYGVETRRLNEQVKRNEDRFPDDFMFQLTEKEWDNLMSQIVTSSVHGGRRKLPYAFTQEGVAMLSSVLNSDRAIQVNIEIMRIFVRFRPLPSASGKPGRAGKQTQGTGNPLPGKIGQTGQQPAHAF